MYLQYRGTILIDSSARDDKSNEEILKSENGSEKDIFCFWEEGDKIVVRDRPFILPKIGYDGELTESTREEMILNGNMLSLLEEGEYVEDGEIKSAEKPMTLIKPLWNRELRVWEEGATKDELINLRKEKILKYAELKKEIATLEEFAEFESDGTIEMLKKQMEQLKKEINELLKVIKKM